MPLVLGKNPLRHEVRTYSSHTGIRVRVSISTATVEGTVYTADPITNLLVLNTSASSSTASKITPDTLTAPAGAYRIIPLSQIQSFQMLTIASPTSPNNSTTFPEAPQTLDTSALQARLSHAISNLQSAQLRIGPKGTSPTDQALFDALSRTHPTRWEGSQMVISDTFVIQKPYGAANVGLYTGRKGDLERMRKVVDMERNKCFLRLSQRDFEGKMKKGG